MRFHGTYTHSLDDRGRIAIPSRYRDVLADGLVFVNSPDGCVELYAREAYDEKADLILTAGDTDPAARRLLRSFFGNSFDGEIDRQGRVLIPQQVREARGLNGGVTIVGRGNCFEIWDAAAYREEGPIADREFPENLQRLKPQTRAGAAG